jgi:hypothetical protein
LAATAGLLWGNGNGARSSLAAAAGGGVTAKLGGNFRIERCVKKRQMAPRHNTRLRDADMHHAGRAETIR